MTKVNISAVVIIPPRNCWEPIQAIRKQHDRHIHRWMPHINLIYPFRTKNEYESLLILFSETCLRIEPVEVNLSNFNYFHHGHEHFTVWLEPEPRKFLKEFQLKLLKIVPDCNDVNKHDGGFTPHLSVGQVNGRDALMRLMSEFKSNWGDLTFLLNEIFFISRENKKDSKFEIEKTIMLKIK